MKHKIFTMILLTILVSCGKPPKGTPILDGAAQLCDFIDRCNECSGDTERLKKLLKDKLLHSDGIIAFPQNVTFRISSTEDLTSDLIYSLDGNQFLTKRAFYITYIKQDMYLSLDAQRWAVIYSNPLKNKGRKYFEGSYRIDHTLDEQNNHVDFIYTISMKLFDEDNIPYTNVKFNRPTLTLPHTIGQTLWTQNDKDVKTILNDAILYIPVGTKARVSGTVDGNIVRADASDDIHIKFKKNIYLYSDIMPSLSFDNISWNINPLNIKIKTNSAVRTDENGVVVFEFANTADIN